MTNYLNWSTTRLRHELGVKGIVSSATFTLTTLRRLYVDNVLTNANSSADTTTSVTTNQQNDVIVHAEASPRQTRSSPRMQEADVESDDVVHLNETVRQEQGSMFSQRNSAATVRSDTVTNNTGNDSSNMAAPMFGQFMAGMSQFFMDFMSQQNSQTAKDVTLAQVYSQEARQSPLAGNLTMPRHTTPTNRIRSFGVSPEDLGNLDLVTGRVKGDIIDGKDVNLASLLIPYFDLEGKNQDDARLKRNLTIGEFITAFGKYKRVMCRAYPDRRDELDAYEANIVNIYNSYGSKFYEYHKMFSLKSATALQQHAIKVDWSVKDRDLLLLIAGGIKSRNCAKCGEVSHDTHFCPLVQSGPFSKAGNSNQNSSRRQDNETDRHGRKRVFHEGTEVCNNFNGSRGCNRANCPLKHVCIHCKATDHGSDSGHCKDNAASKSTKSKHTT
ncbi:uncharacterized protein LOC110445818 [Mizuhopecten yessoensis]|uniref:uncharacterized protein LOC110445818 n=1 Tax=Mizuhopecten yessoensis TaxID=6573 RepID=UPI000B45B470|nr:uncharacterized protein LOC110445818 [Mizuhopecten yessoensis]